MNKRIILLLAAFAAGAGVGYLVTRKLLEDEYVRIAQEEIDSVKEYYGRTSAERLAKQVSQAQDEVDTDNTQGGKSNYAPLTRNSMDDSSYDKAKIAYHDIAKDEIYKRWSSESESAREMDEDEDVEYDDNEPVTDAAGYYEGDMDDDTHERDLSDIDRSLPYVIDDYEFANEFEHHDKLSLYYYAEDDVLCDDHEEIIDNIDDTVGWDCFEKLRMQTIVWVRNEPLSTDYEIISIRAKYSETVHGVNIPYSDAGLTPRERYLKNQKRRTDGEE